MSFWFIFSPGIFQKIQEHDNPLLSKITGSYNEWVWFCMQKSNHHKRRQLEKPLAAYSVPL